MDPFSYVRVQTENEAIERRALAGSMFIAGGTTLVDLMRLNVEKPRHLIDIRMLPLNEVELLPGGEVRIGAMVRNSDLAHHPEIVHRFPVLSQAILSGASGQLRNVATAAGNLMQKTRCYYFRDPAYTACNKREPGSGCAAIEGFNRIHAVLGASDKCIATHPSDMAVALVALDAIVEIKGAQALRRVSIADFYRVPDNTPQIETVLKSGELITHITLPASSFAARSGYVKLRDRASYEFALASAAAGLEVVGARIRSARIALGGVATKPWRSREAEDILVGATMDRRIFHSAAKAALHEAKPQRHNGFKIDLAQMAIIRVLTDLARE
jgi:xanthine dehydrogenase YagS FAD-binding subunit